MLPLLFLIASVALIEAKPAARLLPSFSYSGIVGGTNAAVGEFPWQLSQQRSNSHSCGASLLSANKALSAAHCLDGAAPALLRVIAGLHQRSNEAGTQSSAVASYTMHQQYNQGAGTFANDIATILLTGTISAGGTIGYARLSSGSTTFAGVTCVMSGWGRTSNSNTLPDTLQKASIPVITTSECSSRVGTIGTIWDQHICLYDAGGRIGSCSGDSGGPLNCPESGNTVVAGVTSWGISSGGNCLQTYPSVYTRVSSYLTWISNN